jgi:1-aminocyclopropane-1-carboxylate deaminase
MTYNRRSPKMFEQSPSFLLKPPPYQEISVKLPSGKGFNLNVKRLDLIHPYVNGNKWYKLKYNLEKAISMPHPRILSFGGSHSNHIYSLAAAGKHFGIETIGVIRGEQKESPTLDFARAHGMQLHFISREEYRNKYLDTSTKELRQKFGTFHLVPEGASNDEGVRGCEEILDKSDLDFDIICLASGTASTLTGIVRSAGINQKVLGFSALKGGDFLRNNVLKNLLPKKRYPEFEMLTDYHFGGYAKWNLELLTFIRMMEQEHDLPLDQVYTGKMLFGVLDLINKGVIDREQRILCLHTGGLQGRLPQLTSS